MAADRTINMALSPAPVTEARSGAFMGKRTRKVNQGKRQNGAQTAENRSEIARNRNP